MKKLTYAIRHKHLSRNEMPCQAVFNKMSFDHILNELKDLKNLEKILVFKRLIFKRIAIMHGKGELAKFKASIYNIRIEATNICNILPRPADSNGLILVKLKQDLQYRCYIYFEPVRPNVVYQALNCLKQTINSMRIFPFQKASQAKK